MGFDAVDSAGLLSRLTPHERRHFRRAFAAAVLATDMGQHTSLLARLEAAAPLSRGAADDRVLLVSVLLHAAGAPTPASRSALST